MQQFTNNTYLIIDDSEIDILVVNRMIEKVYPNLKPVSISDGAKGISYMKNVVSGTNVKPSFILLDLQMPLMDGFEFLNIYEREFFHQLPDVKVIILTSSIHIIDKEKAEKYRTVSAYMVKPFSIDEFQYLL
ncbi:MAG: response regulator [Bacteroidota bacterium]